MQKPTLNQKMRKLGFTVSADEDSGFSPLSFDIERDLIEIIIEARTDYRVLSLLNLWFKKHADIIILEKFYKMISRRDDLTEGDPLLNFLIASAISTKHNKWKRCLKTSPRKPIYPIDPENLKAAIKIKGKDEEMAKLGILIPNDFLKTRDEKIYDQVDLAKHNQQYKNRLIIGPNWRADIITAIELGVENPFKISTTLGCGYESAYRVMKDYKIVHAS
jgi:hypothetical protein